MTVDEIKADIQIAINLLSSLDAVAPNVIDKKIIALLTEALNRPLLLRLLALAISEATNSVPLHQLNERNWKEAGDA